MFDDVERADQIIMAIRDTLELRKWRAHDLAAKAFFGKRARLVVELKPFDMPESRQHQEIVTGTAADLEDSGILGEMALPRNQVRNDLSPRAIPPVSLIELRHLPIDDPFHQRKTSRRLSTKVASGVTKIAGINGHHVRPWTSGPVRTQVKISLSTK